MGSGSSLLDEEGRITDEKFMPSYSSLNLYRALRAYPNNPEALKAMRAQAKWRNAR
jgi:hypothetical protein